MERLKRWLADTGTSQTGLGARVGVTQPTVWEWLNGDSTPSGKNLRRLAEVTGLSIDELLSTGSAAVVTTRKAG